MHLIRVYIRCLNSHLPRLSLTESRRLCRKCITTSVCSSRSLNSSAVDTNDAKLSEYKLSFIKKPSQTSEIIDLSLEDESITRPKRIDPLSKEMNTEFLDTISPSLPKTYNTAAFANQSHTIQQLVKLGVSLAKIERKDITNAEFIIKLDFDNDIKPFIQFLHDNGVAPQEFGDFITENPRIFEQHLDDLQVRVNYLESKRFTFDMRAKVISRWPRFLNQSTVTVDSKLGFLQKEYELSGNQVRAVFTQYPKVASIPYMQIREATFMFKEECGFTDEEIKQILFSVPMLWTDLAQPHRYGRKNLIKAFDLVHNEMKIPHELIVKFPNILRESGEIKDRNLYLKKLGRDQYDPTKPLYVPLSAFYAIDDATFCEMYAKTFVNDYNLFLKHL